MSCEHEFVGQPGPTQCQKCGHEYLKWLNYSEEEFGKKK